MFLQVFVLILSLFVTFSFFLYGFNTYYLLRSATRYKAPKPPLNPSNWKPGVAIHLPVYNENYVICRLITACTHMADRYGKEKVRIIILDDSDDETVETVDQVVKEFQEKDYKIEIMRRGSRQGFKAGALQYALERTDEEFIAVFDADFIPPVDFLSRTMCYFSQDESLGIIQSRWEHINRDYNLLTRAIATGIDVHFLIEQSGRFAAGVFQNFNGSGGIIRKKALLEAGGWQIDTLAEDLDASYRIQLKGYRFLFLRELLSPGEVPLTVPSFKKQQGRWACGSLRTAKKLLPSVMQDKDMGLKKQFEAFVHLTGYIVHPLMFISFLLGCTTTIFNIDAYRISSAFPPAQAGINSATIKIFFTHPQFMLWGLLSVLIGLCTIAVWIPPMLVLRGQVLPFRQKLLNVLVLFLLGFGISLSNTIEAGKALFSNRNWAFVRTPKYALQKGKEGWQNKRYQISLSFEWIPELILVALGVTAITDSFIQVNYGELMWLIPFTASYAFVAILTILQSRRTSTV